MIKALENYFEKKPFDVTWDSFAGAVKKAWYEKRKIDRFENGILRDDINLPENDLQNRSDEKASVVMVAETQ